MLGAHLTRRTTSVGRACSKIRRSRGYGFVGFKIHCKATLIVRRDSDAIRRYVHLATGNYNPSTARLYTDTGLLTCRPEFGEDVTNLFNLLTGISQFRPMQRLLVAPFDLAPRLVALVDARRRTPETFSRPASSAKLTHAWVA